MTCLVEYRSDGSVRQYWPLEKNKKYVIGRNPEKASIVISHVSMSRMHAELVIYSKSVFRIKDLNTINGTYLNKTKINGEVEAEICSDDTLFFGENPRQYKVLKEPPPVMPSASKNVITLCEDKYNDNYDQLSPNNSCFLSFDKNSDVKCVDKTTPALSSNSSISSTSAVTPNLSVLPGSNPTRFRNMSLIFDNTFNDSVDCDSLSKLSLSSVSSSSDISTSSSGTRRSGFKSKWDIPVSAPLPSNLSPEEIAKFLKERAQNNAMLIEKQKELTFSSSGLTKQQKRKLLWGRKDSINADGNNVTSSTNDLNTCNDTGNNSHDKSGIIISGKNKDLNDERSAGDLFDEDPNLYSESFQLDSRKKTKFLKLMGHKIVGSKNQMDCSVNAQNCGIVDGDWLSTYNIPNDVKTSTSNNTSDNPNSEGNNANKPTTWKSRDHLDASKNAKREKELEMQFLRGIKRMDGRKTGLGL